MNNPSLQLTFSLSCLSLLLFTYHPRSFLRLSLFHHQSLLTPSACIGVCILLQHSLSSTSNCGTTITCITQKKSSTSLCLRDPSYAFLCHSDSYIKLAIDCFSVHRCLPLIASTDFNPSRIYCYSNHQIQRKRLTKCVLSRFSSSMSYSSHLTARPVRCFVREESIRPP